MPDHSTSPALALLLVLALAGLAVVYYPVREEREHDRAIATSPASRTAVRDALSARSRALATELATACTRLADLRAQGMKIYTLAIEILFSGATACEGQPLLAAVFTLSARCGGTSYRLSNPDLAAELEGDRLRLEADDPSTLVGRDIATLCAIDTLPLNLAPLFKLAGLQLAPASEMRYTVEFDGVSALASTATGSAQVQLAPVFVPVAKPFAAVETLYTNQIGFTGRSAPG